MDVHYREVFSNPPVTVAWHPLRTSLAVLEFRPGTDFWLPKRTELYASSQRAHWLAERIARRFPNLRCVVIIPPGAPGLAESISFYPQCSKCRNQHRPVFRERLCLRCWQPEPAKCCRCESIWVLSRDQPGATQLCIPCQDIQADADRDALRESRLQNDD